MKQPELLVVSLRGLNFGCLVSLRVFRAKHEKFNAGVPMHAGVPPGQLVLVPMVPVLKRLDCVNQRSP